MRERVCFFKPQVNDIGTGAGHGAPGGSYSSGVNGGIVYDNVRAPAQTGSGGGNSINGTGGAGGGYLILKLYTSLVVDGKKKYYKS